jgi:hypothetical protein
MVEAHTSQSALACHSFSDRLILGVRVRERNGKCRSQLRPSLAQVRYAIEPEIPLRLRRSIDPPKLRKLLEVGISAV